MDAKQDFRWDLQALRSFKDDEFVSKFNSFFCKNEIEDDWMRQTTIDYFMENGCLKNLKHVCEYLHRIGSNDGDDLLLQRLIKTHVKTRGNYWRASEIIAHLNMQDDFSFDEILVPLFVGSHADVDFFEQYIGKNNTALQIKFVKFLDSTEDFNRLLLTSYSECKKPCHARLIKSKHGFHKFLSKLVERFELNLEEVAPNFCILGKKKDIKHWIKGINYENVVRGNWRDLMIKKVEDKEPLRIFLIEELVRTKNNDCLEEAAYLLDRLNLELDKLTSKVKSAIENRPQHDLTPSWKVYLTDESAQYLLMNPDLEYSMVDDAKSLQGLCASLKNHYLWGMDCEFNADAMDSKVSLLQLANNDQAFLLDVTALVSTLDKDAWNDFVDVILDGNNLFLGYDPREDFKNLARTTDAFKKLQNLSDLRNLLDIKALIESATQKGIFNLAEPSRYRGLARMSEFFLGKPLDKRQQISDWDKRPLTQAQKEYAVLDAQVLISLYAAIYDRVNDVEKLALSDIESILRRNGNKVIMQKSDKKNRKGSDIDNPRDAEEQNMESMEEPSNEREPIKPPDLRVVCDNMLEGLCKQLRKYGVDAIAIASHDGVEQCAEIANIENRVVLTRNKRLQQLLKIVIHGQCLALKGDCPKDQLKEVFNFFHVINVENYIFSRCMKCNGSNFDLVTQEKLKSLQLNSTQKRPPEAVIDKHQEFYICDQCSHVYWNGSHLARVQEDLKEKMCS